MHTEKLKISIIGRGNVATHLHKALHGRLCRADIGKANDGKAERIAEIETVMVNPHAAGEAPADASLHIIAVSDNAIREVAAKLPVSPHTIVAHTSGTTSIDIIARYHPRTGVIYPMQTFSKNISLDYSSIPFFIEGSDTFCRELLTNVAESVSKTVRDADSDTRRALHLAAVFTCNFTNYLYDIADGILARKGIPFSLMLPLISGSVEKLRHTSPRCGQTGPAVRGDSVTLESHIRMLEEAGCDREADIYRLLSESIIQTHSNHKH